ncbi:MAG: DNA polymerase domain-containing protein, partial [Candidatus Heimdallarchaeota archaeon]
VRILDAVSTLGVTEGVLRNDFRDKKNIVLAKEHDVEIDSEKVLGGFVKDPHRGMSQWVAIFDFASLYPTTQRQNNIGPENYKGIKISNHVAEFNGKRIQIEPNDVICANGAVFNSEFSVTTNKLSEIYQQRKNNKKIMLDKLTQVDILKKELKELEQL